MFTRVRFSCGVVERNSNDTLEDMEISKLIIIHKNKFRKR